MMHIKFNRFNSIKRTQNQQVTVPHCLGSTSPFKTADRRVHSDPIFNIKLLSIKELATSKAGEGSATDMVALVPRSSIFFQICLKCLTTFLVLWLLGRFFIVLSVQVLTFPLSMMHFFKVHFPFSTLD